jgi:hypothetical protein
MPTESSEEQYALVIAVGKGFDRSLSCAAQTTRYGYLHGFANVGVSSFLVPYHHLHEVPDRCQNPIFWLTVYDYEHLSDRALKTIKQHPHIIQVNVWADGMKELHQMFNAPDPTMNQRTLKRVLDSGASFVWCSAPEECLDAYENWVEVGQQKLVSLPWACDNARYYTSPNKKDFSGVQMAFVGGYRQYKEAQYEAYLWPYEDILQVWGYNAWPRCFQGYLDNDDERLLYQNAILCPTISEPQFAVTGDTVERPFKVMGSGGLTILDCVPAYKHLFSDDEALMPTTVPEYRDMVESVLNDLDLHWKYREAGYKAVLERHTYMHRGPNKGCRRVAPLRRALAQRHAGRGYWIGCAAHAYPAGAD